MSIIAKILPVVLALCLTACATSQPSHAPAPSPIAMQQAASPNPAPPHVEESPKEAPSGSLWYQANGSLFKDVKACKVGDIVTITVSEESKGTKEAKTDTSRNKAFEGQFKFDGAGVGASGIKSPSGAVSFGPYKGDFKSTFNGSGSTARTDSMSAYMTATVVNVLPNGNLIIRGSRWTKVNDEMQETVLEGVVRPMDITRNNTVLSQNIAEAKIFLVGKGPVSRQQKPGWLGQLLDLVSPF